MIQLSVLIPSTPDRAEMLKSLLENLLCQKEKVNKDHSILGEIEFVIDDSKRFLDGGLSIGKKRESLVNRAQGRYLCFIDSDDTTAPNYLESLLRLCYQQKDVCTFRAFIKQKNYWSIVDMSLFYQFNEQTNDRYDIRRRPWHICPVRTEFAQQEEFLDINNAEDFQWFERVLKYCSFEAKSSQILYQYNHGAHSSADEITRNGYV